MPIAYSFTNNSFQSMYISGSFLVFIADFQGFLTAYAAKSNNLHFLICTFGQAFSTHTAQYCPLNTRIFRSSCINLDLPPRTMH